MALFDILDKGAEQRNSDGGAGKNKIAGVVIGIVAENYKKELPGRIKVMLPMQDEEANMLKWAKVASSYSGKGWAQYFLPEKNDQVLVIFEQGDPERPYVIGSIPRDQDEIIAKASDEDNQKKQIVTKNGNTILFEDCKDGNGEKDKMLIATAGETHKLILDNENQKIVLMDKDKKCVVEMKSKEGTICIDASNKLIIKSGDSAKIVLDGNSNTIQIKADKIEVGAGQTLTLKSEGSTKVSGQQTAVEGACSLKMSASGMTTIGGSPIKVG